MISLVLMGAVVIPFAALSAWLARRWISAPMFFFTAGAVAFFLGIGPLRIGARESLVHDLAQATLGATLFVDAWRIDLAALRREIDVPARLLGIGLPLTVAAGLAAALGLVPGLTAGEALVLAVTLAPTDAALGQKVVTDPRLPDRVSQGLNVESGLNDGLCVPLLFIALAVAQTEGGTASGPRAALLVGQAIGWGVVGGLVGGGAAAVARRLAGLRGLGDPLWLPLLPVAAAALAFGLATIPGGSGFIATFVAGLVFGTLARSAGDEEARLLEGMGEGLNAATFTLFGLIAPAMLLAAFSWRIALFAVVSLTAVRMVPVALAMIGTRAAPATVAFMGWFGPRGLASIVFVILVLDEGDIPHLDPLMAAVAATVGLSIYAHGLTAPPLTERYLRWFRTTAPHPMEGVPVTRHRWREGAGIGRGDA